MVYDGLARKWDPMEGGGAGQVIWDSYGRGWGWLIRIVHSCKLTTIKQTIISS